eukprot:TRINITY_DN10590_c0_g1_i1.p1 TRINITY_DN10590_c0_g1~~TRINITY_DN10590_c0_g1_i1.p1  ORF type:complete len:611 (+),score=172.34 TRINITY_DN10590_c0_g1_i1:48-1880(+)
MERLWGTENAMLNILTYCDDRDLCVLMHVSRKWYTASTDDEVWKTLCQSRFGVVAKPVTVDSWIDWYQIVQNPKRHAETRNSPGSPSELMAVLKSQGEKIAHMDQQYAAALGTIRQMCDERRAMSPPSGSDTTPRKLLQPAHPINQSEEHDGIEITSDGKVLYEEERATFVDATYDEEFVVRRVSSSPTAAAVLSPYRVKVDQPVVTHSAEKRGASEPRVVLPPMNDQQLPEQSETETVSEPTPMNTDDDIVQPTTPPRLQVVRSASPNFKSQTRTTNHLGMQIDQPVGLQRQQPVEPSPAPIQHPSSIFASTPILESVPKQLRNADTDEEVSNYLAIALKKQLDAEQDHVSHRLYKGVQQIIAENQNLRSMYYHQQESSEAAYAKLQKLHVKHQETTTKCIAMMSRLQESKKCFKKLKNHLASQKVEQLDVHNEVLKAKLEEENQVRNEAEQYLSQRDQLIAELEQRSLEVVAFEKVFRDMEVQHERNIQRALESTIQPSGQEISEIEKENVSLRINLDGTMQVIHHVYAKNEQLKEEIGKCFLAAEEPRRLLADQQQKYAQLIAERQQERNTWSQYEERYIKQISLLQRSLQQQKFSQAQAQAQAQHP